jgi:hypothetical protein
MGILDQPWVQRVRRNHAIEHATIHLLTPKYSHQSLAGRADALGFHLYGAVDTDDVRTAVRAALAQLRDHPELAVHPRCGTNLVVSGFVGGLASLAAIATLSNDRRDSPLLEILPRMTLAAMAAAVVGQTLGPVIQERVTTSPLVDGAVLESVERSEHGRHILHRVRIGQSSA